jgi:hypothetical protein
VNWFFSCLTKLYEILKFEQFKVTLYWILTTSLQSFSPSFHSIKSLNFLIYGLEKSLNFTLPYLYEFCMLSAIYTVYIFSFHNVWPAFFNHFLLSWFSHLLCNDCYPTFSSIMFLTSIPWYLPTTYPNQPCFRCLICDFFFTFHSWTSVKLLEHSKQDRVY